MKYIVSCILLSFTYTLLTQLINFGKYINISMTE